MSKSKRSAGWADVADWYDPLVGDSGSEYHQKIVLPGALRLLAPQAGERMIDIACGQGVLCRMLAQRKIETTGIDAAESMIAAARARGPETIRYQVADARESIGLPAAHFHAAACLLAIQNIHPLPPVCAAVAKLLLPGGRFVIVMTHPCFRGAKETSWGWDEKEKIQYRRVDRYLVPRKTPIVTHPGSDPTQYTWSYHRPIEDYVKSLSREGLLIDAMEEWPSHKISDSGPRAPAENTSRKEIPLFLAMRAMKIDSPAAAGC
jgi:ubiquinone/menaquinone biosynthesis C-methylase UbiE